MKIKKDFFANRQFTYHSIFKKIIHQVAFKITQNSRNKKLHRSKDKILKSKTGK